MVNQSIIKAKMISIENNLGRLKEKQSIALEKLKNDKDVQDIILHNLQLAIQGCIDIASHIISDEGWQLPDTLAGLFEILRQHGVITVELQDNLKKMVGFRNIIIHEYGAIDLDKVYTILTRDVIDIYDFLKQVCSYSKI